MNMQAARLGTCQKIAVAVASAAVTNAFAATTTLVRVCSDTLCYIEFGAAPTAATATSHLLPANRVEYFYVAPSTKIAAIRHTADGTLTVTEC